MTRSFVRRLAVAAVLACLAAPSRAESVLMTVDRPTLLNFLRAATPYSFQVTKAGLKETLTLLNPRELRFEGGKIRLKVDCLGEPIPFEGILEPTLAVYFDRARSAFVAKVESLPVNLGAFGAIQLEQYLHPVTLPSAFSQTLEAGVPGLTIDTLVRDVRVLEDRIEAKADLIFRKQPSAPRTTTGK